MRSASQRPPDTTAPPLPDGRKPKPQSRPGPRRRRAAARPPREPHRTTATYRERIRGYPSVLYIYQHRASPFWWVRYWERGRTYRRSTRTEDRITAIAFAKQYFSDIKQRIRQGPTATRSASAYDTLLNSLLASERAKLGRGELTQITYDNMVYRFDKKITPFFSGWDITEINYQQVSEFLNQISEDDLTSSTISAYVRLVRKLLQHAARQGVIMAVPEMPVVSVRDNPRGWFMPREYLRLVRWARRLAGHRFEVRKYRDSGGAVATQIVDVAAEEPRRGDLMRHVDMTADLASVIEFMVNSFVRPTDIKVLQHGQVDRVQGRYRYLRLRLPPTKGHSDPITTMTQAVGVYERLRDRHQRSGVACGDQHYVFLPEYGAKQRDYALKQFQRQFEILLALSGLGHGTTGEPRSMYSLRHTSIMYRLLYGGTINTLVLARNARTSPEMIDRFYARPLSGAMNIDQLLARRRPVSAMDSQNET